MVWLTESKNIFIVYSPTTWQVQSQRVLAFRLESVEPELGVGTAWEGVSQLRLDRVDICGDQGGCNSLATPNAISEAAGLILAPSMFVDRSGHPFQDWLRDSMLRVFSD